MNECKYPICETISWKQKTIKHRVSSCHVDNRACPTCWTMKLYCLGHMTYDAFNVSIGKTFISKGFCLQQKQH